LRDANARDRIAGERVVLDQRATRGDQHAEAVAHDRSRLFDDRRARIAPLTYTPVMPPMIEQLPVTIAVTVLRWCSKVSPRRARRSVPHP